MQGLNVSKPVTAQSWARCL